MLRGLCWAGEFEGLSAGVFDVGAGAEVEFGVGDGEDVVVCSLAG